MRQPNKEAVNNTNVPGTGTETASMVADPSPVTVIGDPNASPSIDPDKTESWVISPATRLITSNSRVARINSPG